MQTFHWIFLYIYSFVYYANDTVLLQRITISTDVSLNTLVHLLHLNITLLIQLCYDVLQSGEDPYDALSCRSFSAKEPLIIGLFCGEWPIKIRDPMGLRHPVRLVQTFRWISVYIYYICIVHYWYNFVTTCYSVSRWVQAFRWIFWYIHSICILHREYKFVATCYSVSRFVQAFRWIFVYIYYNCNLHC